MLQYIRTHAQGWVALLIVGLIALAFTLFGMEGVLNKSSPDIVASVDKHKITYQEFDRNVERLSRMRHPGSDEEVSQLKQATLDRMVNMLVLQATTEDLGLAVSNEQIQNAIMGSPDFQENGAFSRERYQAALRGAMLTDNEVHKEIRHMILVDQLQKGVVESAFVLDSDVNSLIKYIDQKRDIELVRVERDRFENDIIIQDEVAQDYYDKHPNLFSLPERVKADYIELSLAPIAAKIELSEAEIRAFYDEHIVMFSEQERVRASHILISVLESDEISQEKAQETMKLIYDRLATGESFESLAAQYSEDTISGKQGGDVDWFSKGQMIESFETVAFEMEVGDVSEPVLSDYGYHIIKLTDKRGATQQPFMQVRRDVEATVRNMRAEEILFDSLEQASMLAYEHPNNLQIVSDTLNLDIQSTDYFSQTDGLGIFTHPKVIEAAFSAEVKDEGLNSELIQVHSETYILLNVTDVKPVEEQPFETIKSELVNALKSKQARELTKGLSKDVLAEVKSGIPLSKVAKTRGLKIETVKELTRTDTRVTPDIIEIAFSIERSMDQTPTGMAQQLNDGSFVTVLLTNIEDGNAESLIDDRKEALEKGVEQSFGQTDYQLLLTEHIKDKKIDIQVP